MKDGLFAVFDVKMKLFTSPFCARNVDSAIRQFADMCSNPQIPFGKHPEDYVLYELGTFDLEDGLLEALKAPHVVSKALDFQDKPAVAAN